MANYVEYIKVGSGESWPVRDAAAHEALDALNTILETELTNISLKMHPVGSIYISVDETDPSDVFGGTWERIQDTFLLAAGDFFDAGQTGGEIEHTLTVGEMPAHTHDFRTVEMAGELNQNGEGVLSEGGIGPHDYDPPGVYGTPVVEAGGTKPHNNMPPYLAVYMWKRIS